MKIEKLEGNIERDDRQKVKNNLIIKDSTRQFACLPFVNNR